MEMTKRLFPFEISTSINLDAHTFEIENKTDTDLLGIVISIQDGYSHNLLHTIADIHAKSKSTFIMGVFQFRNYENGVRLRLYSGGEKIYERLVNHKRKRAFVLYSNKAFEETAKCAIEGLRNFSELEINYYTIGFDSQIGMPGVRCIRHDISGVNENFDDQQYMQMVKPLVFLRALDDGIEDALFIDSDVQVKGNIEDVFERFSHVDRETPILNKNYWQYLFVNGNHIPQDELKDVMGHHYEEQFQGHGVTNIFLFRKEMRPLFEKWKFWCRNEEMLNVVRKKVYVHDEVIFNVLCWKEQVRQYQANLLFNVKDLKDVKAFHHLRAEPGQTHLDFNAFGCGHFSQSFAPYETDDIVGFHCVKDPEMARKINSYLKGI